MKTVSFIALTTIAALMGFGCSGEQPLPETESMESILKQAKVDPNGKSKNDTDSVKKVDENPIAGSTK